MDRKARSAATAAAVGGWCAAAARAVIRASSARISTAIAPCPGGGTNRSGGRYSVMASAKSRRCRPAAARMAPSHSSPAALRIRVSTLPRIGTMVKSGRYSASCAARRGLLVPMRAPAGSRARVCPKWQTRTSRGSARSGIAPIAIPSGKAVGISLRLWTAKSISPAARRRSISLTKTPRPIPAKGAARLASPWVVTITSSKATPGWAARSRDSTSSVCASASRLPRVPDADGRAGATGGVSVRAGHRGGSGGHGGGCRCAHHPQHPPHQRGTGVGRLRGWRRRRAGRQWAGAAVS